MFSASVLWLEALWGHVPVEPLIVLAVIVDHVVVSHPLHLALLIVAQLAVVGWRPPVTWHAGSTLANAPWAGPCASPRPKVAVVGPEGCPTPVGLDPAALGCPVVCIPQARIEPHPLLVRVWNPFLLVVSVHPDGDAVDVPPGNFHPYFYRSPNLSVEKNLHITKESTWPILESIYIWLIICFCWFPFKCTVLWCVRMNFISSEVQLLGLDRSLSRERKWRTRGKWREVI